MSLEPQRRRFQFSLRWMLGALSVFAVLFAIGGYLLQVWNSGEEGRRMDRMNAFIQNNGGYWGYTEEYGGGNFVYLGNANATKTQLDTILKELSKFDDQVSMNFTQSEFGDEHLQRLVGHPRLAYLVADHTAVTDAGLEHISKLRKLEFLSLDDTAITDAGLEHLAKLPKLEFLRVSGTKVTNDGIAKLKRTLPKLEVDVYQGH